MEVMFETDIEKAISKASKVSLRYQLRIFIENKETGEQDYINYINQPNKTFVNFIITSDDIIVQDVNGEIKTAPINDIVLIEYF